MPDRPGKAIQGVASSGNPSLALTVTAHIRITDAKTGEVKDDFAPIDALPYQRPGSWVIPITREIPYNKLPKDAYRLEVQATDSGGKNHRLARGKLHGRVGPSKMSDAAGEALSGVGGDDWVATRRCCGPNLAERSARRNPIKI